jgi:hypothetical protein
MPNQLFFEFASEVHVLQSAKNEDGADLVAIGGEHSVDILIVGEHAVKASMQLSRPISMLTGRRV